MWDENNVFVPCTLLGIGEGGEEMTSGKPLV